MNRPNIVFSTDKSLDLKTLNNVENEIASIKEQRVRIHLLRNSGGKVASVVKGLEGDNETFSNLSKLLKKKCGVGGSYKNGQIIIQGDNRKSIKAILEKIGYNVKLSGG
tara:strand:- start:150 stop:476 length:327 start_codon:yes stop_codon:yes gene_type:complete